MRQVLLYVGQGKLRMPDRLAEDGNLFQWEVVDIRDFDATALMATGNPGDLALAMLAGGGDRQISKILKKAARLKGPARDRLLTQLLVLAGLRGVVGQVQSEMESMGVVIDITKNPFLLKLHQDALKEGKALGEARGKALGEASGEAKGEAKALSRVLHRLLEDKFGPLPKWAKDRIAKSDAAQLDRWVGKALKASGTSIEGVIGKR